MSAENTPNINSDSLPPEITNQYSDVITEEPIRTTGDTWDTVQEITEKDIQAPVESPKAVFAQAYEKVRNLEVVSNITYHVGLWWNGAMDKDIARLEKLKAAQENKAGEHENIIAASADAKNRLDAIRGDLKIGASDEKANVNREVQQAALESRAAMHREKASYLDTELAKKITIREQFESSRTEARNSIVGKFESKIADNKTAIEYVDSQIGEIEKNLEVGQRITANLQAKQDVLRGELSNATLLDADRKAISVTMQEIERRITNIDTAATMERAKIEQYTTKKDTLTQQSEKWRGKIAKKQEAWKIKKEPEVVKPDIRKPIDTGSELSDDVQEEQNIPNEEIKERDPRAELLDEMQSIMANPDFKKYRKTDFIELILEQGTPDQKLLLQTNGFFTKLLAFLESRAEPEKNQESKNEEISDEESSEEDIISKTIQTLNDVIVEEEVDPYIAPEDIERIEKTGTKEEKLISKLLQALLDILSSFEVFEGRQKKAELKRKQISL